MSKFLAYFNSVVGTTEEFICSPLYTAFADRNDEFLQKCYNVAMRFTARLGVLPYLLPGAGLFAVGLMALSYIVDNWWPFNVVRLDLVRATALDRIDSASLLEAANSEIIVAFLAAVMLAVTGVALPLVYVLNERFSHFANQQLGLSGPPRFIVILRQAIAVGLWVAFCVWLQMNRAFGLAIAVLVAAVLVLFEVLLQIRTRATRVTEGR